METMIIKIAIMTRLISYAMTSFHIEINLFIPVYEWMLKNERGIKLDTVWTGLDLLWRTLLWF